MWVELLGAAAGQVYLTYTFLEQFIVTYLPVSVFIIEVVTT